MNVRERVTTHLRLEGRGETIPDYMQAVMLVIAQTIDYEGRIKVLIWG